MQHYCLSSFRLLQQNTINCVAYKKLKFSPHSSGGQKSKIKVVMDLVH